MSGRIPEDASVGYLLAVVQRRKSLAIRSLLAPFGLTPLQYGVLARLHDEDGLSLHLLADRLYRDVTALSRTLTRMEAAELVGRCHDPSDRRRVLHHLTPAGRGLLREVRPLVRSLDRRLLRALGDSEVDHLRAILRGMLAELDGECP